MPTTLVGLVLFVVLVSPGLTYLMVAERGRSAIRDLTVFRELATIALSSVIFNAVALLIFYVLRISFPHNTPDVGRLIAQPANYFEANYALCLLWAAVILVTAVVAAAVAAGLLARPGVVSAVSNRKIVQFFRPDKVHFVSAWTKVLEDKNPDRFRLVTLRLQDEICLRGYLLAFNPDANESADRAISLSSPVEVRTNGRLVRTDFGVFVIENRNIVAMHVDYMEDVGDFPVEWAL